MKNLLMREFEPADALALKETIDTDAQLLDWAAGTTAAGAAWTGLVDGKVAGCGGIVILWPGVAEAWSVFAPWCGQRHKRGMLVVCRRYLKSSARRFGLWRIQATLRTDLPQSWLEHLGFVKEGLIRKYSPDGCDASMWAMIFNTDTVQAEKDNAYGA